MKILVVDDERAVRESLRRALELEGYEIELAGDGNEALSRLEQSEEPDAMILDVLMPGVDGLEVCRRIRGTGSKLPVLMLTARTEVEDRVAGLDAGADDYLTKPFALQELLARLRALLRRVVPAEGGDASATDGERLHDARVSIEREDLAAGEHEVGRGHGAYSTIPARALATFDHECADPSKTLAVSGYDQPAKTSAIWQKRERAAQWRPVL